MTLDKSISYIMPFLVSHFYMSGNGFYGRIQIFKKLRSPGRRSMNIEYTLDDIFHLPELLNNVANL